MFYPSDILKKRGKFGLIWLAATKAKKLHRRQICSVNIVEASEDIRDILTTHILTGMKRKVYFSLYLSSQLVNGLTHIHNMQARFLLEDLKMIVLKLNDSKRPSIDLNKTLSKAKVTLEELDMNDVPLDFGSFYQPPEPSDHVISHEYFLLTTPKSSEASTPDFEHPRQENSLHLARREDITLTDRDTFFREEPLPEGEAVDQLVPPLESIPPSTEFENVQPFDLDAIPFPREIEKSIFLTPEVVGEELLAEPQPELSMTPDVPLGRRAVSESSNGFVLPPTVPGRKRRKRKRHLLVDPVTSLTADQIKRNIASANFNLTTPLAFPDTSEPAMSLMTRLGSGFLAPKGILHRIKMLKTMSQIEEDKDLRENRDQFNSPVRRRISVTGSMEQQRSALDASKDPSGSGLLKTASIRGLEASSTLSAGPEDTVGSQLDRQKDILHSTTALDIEAFGPHVEDRFSVPFPVFETSIPLQEFPELITEDRYSPDQVEKKWKKECFVSPERTPPPPSPPPLLEILEEAYALILKTVAASIVHNVTTFSAMIENTAATKKCVASLFHSLLCLHKDGKISIQQPVTGGEIFIEIFT